MAWWRLSDAKGPSRAPLAFLQPLETQESYQRPNGAYATPRDPADFPLRSCNHWRPRRAISGLVALKRRLGTQQSSLGVPATPGDPGELSAAWWHLSDAKGPSRAPLAFLQPLETQ